ncbi:MAG: riboflavin biosynthesis protein RibD [Eggerthellaceae bacterium]|nr:riboflavin biosynthesis protein RibD [Eggerthellaceae bacterium]
MPRPYTICHLLCSVDGRISGPFMGSPAAAGALQAYGRIAADLACQATIYGTTTMLDFCPGVYDDPLAEPGDIDPRTADDFVADPDAGSYIVALDRRGIIEYPGATMTRRGRTSHLVAALTRRVSSGYLAYLRRTGVSYVFAGDEDIDCALLLDKLGELLDVDRALLAGGGRVDWSFLSAGALDEVSLVVAPVVDGSPEAATTFERLDAAGGPPAALALSSSEDLGGGTLWLRYRTTR